MPQQCTACIHAEREAVDEAVVLGQPLRDIARRFGLSKDAVSRHREHVSPALSRMVAEREEAGPRSALARLEQLYERVERVLTAAESEGAASLSLAAARELRATVELLAKLTGELDERPQVQVLNVATSPEWLQVRGALMAALRAYPEAARAVAGSLAQLEVGPS